MEYNLHVLINPRRACAARVTAYLVCVSVCVCVCLSVLHLTSPTFIRPKTILRTSRWMKIRKFVRFSLKILRYKDRALFAYRGEVRRFCLPGYNCFFVFFNKNKTKQTNKNKQKNNIKVALNVPINPG